MGIERNEKMNKLQVLQQKLKAPKDLYNSFGGYSYRSAESILQALKPLLAETKTTILITDDLVNIGERYYVKAIVRLFDIETKEVIAETTAFAREKKNKKGMDGSQITGASSSYARKYALNGMFLIDDVKDSDATNMHGQEEKAQKPSNEKVKCSKCGKEISAKCASAFGGKCADCYKAEKAGK